MALFTGQARRLNFTGYRNAEVDELLVEARSMTDQDRRKELYDRVQEILDAEQPYCFLYVPTRCPSCRRGSRASSPR